MYKDKKKIQTRDIVVWSFHALRCFYSHHHVEKNKQPSVCPSSHNHVAVAVFSDPRLAAELVSVVVAWLRPERSRSTQRRKREEEEEEVEDLDVDWLP